MARIDGALPREAYRPPQGRDRRGRRTRHALEPDAAGDRPARFARSIRAIGWRGEAAAVVGRRHRVRAGRRSVALDPGADADVRAADEHLPRAHRAPRFEDPRGHHGHEGSRACAREAGRRRDRGGEVSRPSARHSVRRERPARHEGHPDDVRAPSRSGTGCRPPIPPSCAGSTTPAPCSSRSLRSALSRSTTSGSAARR